MKNMNERTASIFDFETREQAMDDPSVRRPSFIKRQLYNLGVYEMAASTRPPELRINYTTLLFYVAVITAIAGGFWWTYDRIADANYQRGREEERRIQQDKDMESLKREILYLQKTKEAEQKEQGK